MVTICVTHPEKQMWLLGITFNMQSAGISNVQ